MIEEMITPNDDYQARDRSEETREYFEEITPCVNGVYEFIGKLKRGEVEIETKRD